MKKFCISNCNHNIVQTLSIKLDTLWRIDQYRKDARREKHADCVRLWDKIAKDECRHVEMLRKLIETKGKKGMFN